MQRTREICLTPAVRFHPPEAQQAAIYGRCGGGFQARIQATTTTCATFSPSQDKTTLPIPAKHPHIDHNSHLGRAQLHREGENVTKKGGVSKKYGSNARKYGAKFRQTVRGESLIRVGAVGIRIRKTPPRFPNYLGRRTNFPPHRDTTGSNLQQGRGKIRPHARKQVFPHRMLRKELLKFQVFAGEIGADARDLLLGGL